MAMRAALIGLALALLAAVPAQADIQCGDWPEERLPIIPEPFSNWLVVQCDAGGQSLTARMAAGGRIWVEHGGTHAYAISAAQLPGGATALAEDRFGPNFTVLGARQLPPLETRGLLQQFSQSFPAAQSASEPDAIWLISLASSARRTIHNLIAFTWSGQPRHLIHCLDECRTWTALDVLSLDELAQRKAAAE